MTQNENKKNTCQGFEPIWNNKKVDNLAGKKWFEFN